MSDSNRRQFYRIPYPAEERPRLVVGSAIHEVLNCSEKGLMFRPSKGEAFQEGDAVIGRMRLASREEIPVAGTVVRVEDGRVSVHLDASHIPFALIIKEQLHLRRDDR